MEELQVKLSEEEFERLNGIYPPTVKSSNVGKRAEEIVKFHFCSLYKDCTFTEQSDGSDLLIEWSGGNKKIEIKGTAADDIAWTKLKVSSQNSHDLLEKGLPLYRVVSVYDRNPRIFVLLHGQDFLLSPEARWSVIRA